MSSYLARLKSEKRLHDELPKLPKGQKRLDSVLPKPPKAPFDSFDSDPCSRFQKNDDPDPDPDTLHRLIGETLAEIDRRGRPWTGWRKSLTPEQRDRLRELESEIDATALAGDRLRLTAALAEYRATILNELALLRRMAHRRRTPPDEGQSIALGPSRAETVCGHGGAGYSRISDFFGLIKQD